MGGVEGVDAVMFSGDEDDIVNPLAGDDHSGQVQRLPVDLAVHRISEERAELSGTDAGGSEQSFGQILSGACKIVVIGEDAYLAVPPESAEKYRIGGVHPPVRPAKRLRRY